MFEGKDPLIFVLLVTWAPSQYKDGLSKYGDSHVKDKTRDCLIINMESLYW